MREVKDTGREERAAIIQGSQVESVVDRAIKPMFPMWYARRVLSRAQATALRVMMSYGGAYPSLHRETAWGPLVTEEAELQGFTRFQLMLEGRDLYRNFPIIRAGVNGVARRAIGSGIQLQINTDDRDWNTEALDQWNDWCEHVDTAGNYDLPGLLRQCVRSCYTDGDLGIGFTDNDGDLLLAVVEGDRIAEDYRAGVQIDRHNPIGGVNVDWDTGRAESFLVGRRNAGGILEKTEPWPADSFVLFYRRQRVDQVRGVPLLAPVIQPARDLQKYLDATRIAANLQATFGVFIKRQSPGQLQLAQSQAVDGTSDYRTVPMKTGQMWWLRPDEDVVGFNPTVPAQQFDQFARFMVRIIAIGMNTTYEILMYDMSNMSFSSARAHLMAVDEIHEEWQRCLVQRVLKRVWPVWVARRMTPVKDGGCGLLKFNPQAFTHTRWQGPAKSSVDPVGDADANIRLVENSMTTLQDYYHARGEDWKEKVTQRQREKEFIESIGGVDPTKPVSKDAIPSPAGRKQA